MMDKLLRRMPSPLANERVELFSLIDRFGASILAYQKQYASVTDSKDKDLRQHDEDRRKVLEKLRAVQAEEKDSIEKDHESLRAALERQITSCENVAASEIRREEERLAGCEEEEKRWFSREYKNLESILTARKGIVYCIDRICREVETDFEREAKAAKQQYTRADPSSDPGDIVSREEALYAVDMERVSEAKELRSDIFDLEDSLPKKMAFFYKRKKYVERIFEMGMRAREGFAFLEKSMGEELAEKRRLSDGRRREMRLASGQKKQEILQKKAETVRKLEAERESIRRSYEETCGKLDAAQRVKYRELEEHYDARGAALQKKWEAEQEKCDRQFVSTMEELYPEVYMNAWLRKFWDHPARVEDYDKFAGMQFNTLIGAAVIDISGWYAGGMGNTIREVMKKYGALFGPDEEKAAGLCREGKMMLPYTISIEEGTSLHVSCADRAEERVKAMLNAVGMRLLRSVPACGMRFSLFDAGGIGAFGRLTALDPERKNHPGEPAVKSFVAGERGGELSDREDIARQISEMRMTLSDLSRQLARYGSLSEFNSKNPLSRQIYRPVLMMNFPMGLSEKEVRTLAAMSSDCAGMGFFMVLAQPDKADQSVKPELKREIDELKKNALCMRMEENERALRVLRSDFLSERAARIFLYGMPAPEAMEEIADQIRRESVEASRTLIHFSEAEGICPGKGGRYLQKSDDGAAIPTGYLEGGEPFSLPFDDRHIHAIVMGNIRSGKTNLLHVLMTGMMLRYAPKEAMIYLIDFKYGLDFRIYAQYNLPNFKVISINNEPEFALVMLRDLEKEQETRSIRMGSRYHKISEYNEANPQDKMSRIFLIVDELYELTKRASDETRKNILNILDSLAHQTGAFGIHMILCGQDLDKMEKFETIKNQCMIRIALHCADEQVRELMGDAGVARMHTIDEADQGACVFSVSGGTKPQIERTTYLGSDKQIELLEEIHEYYMEKRQITQVKVLLTKVSNDPNHPFSMFVSDGIVPETDAVYFRVGSALSMDGELHFCPAEHVWLLGGRASGEAFEAGISFVFFSVLSLTLAKLRSDELDIICTNCGDHPMRSAEAEERDRFGQLASRFPSLYRYGTGRELRETLRSVMDELDDRRDHIKSSKRALWWFIALPEEVPGLGDESGFIIDMGELLRQGAKYNIHVVIWNADAGQAQRLQLDKGMFRDIVCLEMPAEEARQVIGSAPKPEPSGYKALLTGDQTRRFCVYDQPDGGWMNELAERLYTYSK